VKLLNLFFIFSFLWIGTSCVPEDEFLKDEKNSFLNPNLTDDELGDEDQSTGQKNLEHVLSFDEMVEYMQISLNNNHLDSGRSAYFTAQAPFSSMDSLIVYTQSKCSGKIQEVPFGNLKPLDLIPDLDSDEKIYIYQRDPNLSFYGNIARPEPKINYSIAKMFPPYEFSINGLKEGVSNYSFRFERDGQTSRCLSFVNTEHIIRRVKPNPPTNIVITTDSDPDGDGEKINTEDNVSFQIFGEYIGENVVGLFLPQGEGEVCRLENIIYTKELGFTPGIKIDLVLSEHSILKDLRGEVNIYAGFINPYGMVSDCYGPVFSEIIGKPVTPNIQIVKNDSNPNSNVIKRLDGETIATKQAKIEFDYNIEPVPLQSDDVYYISRSAGCSDPKKEVNLGGDPEIPGNILTTDEEILPILDPILENETTHYSIDVYNSFTELPGGECKSVEVIHDNRFPTFSDSNIVIKDGPSGCTNALVDNVHYTNCDDIVFGFKLTDSGTWLTRHEFSTDPACGDVSPFSSLETSDFLENNSGSNHGGVVNVKSGAVVYLHTMDGLGNTGCQKTNISNSAPHDISNDSQLVTKTWMYDDPSGVSADLDVSIPVDVVEVGSDPGIKVRTYNILSKVTLSMEKTNPSDNITYYHGGCSDTGRVKLENGTMPMNDISVPGPYLFSGSIQNSLRPEFEDCDQLIYVYDPIAPEIIGISLAPTGGANCTIDGNLGGGFVTSCESVDITYKVKDELNRFCHSVDPDPRCSVFNNPKNIQVTVTQESEVLSLGSNTITLYAQDEATNETTIPFNVKKINKPVLVASLVIDDTYQDPDNLTKVFGLINSPGFENEQFYTRFNDDIKIKVLAGDGSLLTLADLPNPATDVIRFYEGIGCPGAGFADAGNDYIETINLADERKYSYSIRVINILGEEGECIDISNAYVFDETPPVPTVANYLCNGVVAPVTEHGGRKYIECSVDDSFTIQLNSGEAVNQVMLETHNPDPTAVATDPGNYQPFGNLLTTEVLTLNQINNGVTLKVLDAAGNQGIVTSDEIFILDYDLKISVVNKDTSAELPIQFIDSDPYFKLEININDNVLGGFSDTEDMFKKIFKNALVKDYPNEGLLFDLSSYVGVSDSQAADIVTYEFKKSLSLINDYNGNDLVVPYDRYYIEPTLSYDLLGASSESVAVSYVFDERPTLLDKLPPVFDSKLTGANPSGDPLPSPAFQIIEKECLSADSVLYKDNRSDKTYSRVFCGGYAKRQNGKKDILIRELRSAIDSVGQKTIHEWILGQDETDEECLDIKLEVVDVDYKIRVICGGHTTGDFDLGGGTDSNYTERSNIELRYNVPILNPETTYNFTSGNKQGADTWVRFDIDIDNSVKLKPLTDGQASAVPHRQAFALRFTIGFDDLSTIVDTAEWTQWGGNKGPSSCKSITKTITLGVDFSVYCAGDLNGVEAIFKLYDRVEVYYGQAFALGTNEVGNGANFKFSLINPGSQGKNGIINAMKFYKLGVNDKAYFFIGGKTNYDYPDPGSTGTAFLIDGDDSPSNYNAFVGLLTYEPLDSNNKLFKNNALIHSNPLTTAKNYWINTLNAFENVISYEGDDTCEDIIVLGQKAGNSYSDRSIDAESSVKGIACAGHTVKNGSDNFSFLETDHTLKGQGLEDNLYTDAFIWLTGLSHPEVNLNQYWGNQAVWSRQLHRETSFTSSNQIKAILDVDQKCESLVFFSSGDVNVNNPSLLVCGGDASYLAIESTKNNISSTEIFNGGIADPYKRGAFLWGIEFLTDFSTGNILGSQGNNTFLKFLPNYVRDEQILAPESNTVDHNKNLFINSGSESEINFATRRRYSSCFDLIQSFDLLDVNSGKKYQAASSFSTLTPYIDEGAFATNEADVFFCVGGEAHSFKKVEDTDLDIDAHAFPFLFLPPTKRLP